MPSELRNLLSARRPARAGGTKAPRAERRAPTRAVVMRDYRIGSSKFYAIKGVRQGVPLHFPACLAFEARLDSRALHPCCCGLIATRAYGRSVDESGTINSQRFIDL